MKRRWEIDALRGLMLVLMNLTHLPTRFAGPTGQPFGFVSAAEGFVLLAGFVAGMVYSERARRDGFASMRRAFLMRAVKLYACQAALLLFLFTIIALLGIRIDQPAVKNLMSFYLQHHATGLWSGLLLIYNPPLLDILPMYIALMLVSPWLLTHGLERGWRGILVASAVLWLLAQFNGGHLLYDALVALTGLPVPFRETGSFSVLGWQLLWVMGLWLGSGSGAAVRPPVPTHFPRWILLPVIGFALACLLWRHVIGQTPFPDSPALNALFDKWPLGAAASAGSARDDGAGDPVRTVAGGAAAAAALPRAARFGIAAGLLRPPGDRAAGTGARRRPRNAAPAVARRAGHRHQLQPAVAGGLGDALA